MLSHVNGALLHFVNVTLYSVYVYGRGELSVVGDCQCSYTDLVQYSRVYIFDNLQERQNIFVTRRINPSSPKGVATTPLTVFALVLKIAQPRGKTAPGTSKFILSIHFSEKISNLPPTPGIG